MAINKRPAPKKKGVSSAFLDRFKSKYGAKKGTARPAPARKAKPKSGSLAAKKKGGINTRSATQRSQPKVVKPKSAPPRTRTGGTATTTTKTGPRPSQPKPTKKPSPKPTTNPRKGIGSIIRCGGLRGGDGRSGGRIIKKGDGRSGGRTIKR